MSRERPMVRAICMHPLAEGLNCVRLAGHAGMHFAGSVKAGGDLWVDEEGCVVDPPPRNPNSRAHITVGDLDKLATMVRVAREERDQARAVATRLARIAKCAVIGEIPDTSELFKLGLVVADWAPQRAKNEGGPKS